MTVRQERDGMLIEWDVPISMEDGTVLRADVYGPTDDGAHPVILTHGPYGKGVHFADHAQAAWEALGTLYPDSRRGSSNAYQVWETADPERIAEAEASSLRAAEQLAAEQLLATLEQA